MVNLEVRVLSDGTIFYRYTKDGRWLDGSQPTWAAFTHWLAQEIGA